MYILDFLKGFPNNQKFQDVVSFDYRLLCSGVLYNSNVFTTDWSKSDAARILFDLPFTLIVCSYPFDEFPQELALRFSAPFVEETKGLSTSLFYPDDDIAHDLASLLTLACRRLITVAAKVQEHYPKHYENELPFYQEWPVGFINSLNPIHWSSQSPPPLGVDTIRLKRLLHHLPKLSCAENIVLSARLYTLALQQLEHDSDIAYQLLIAAAESMANEALKDCSF
jgi:hypothetical protein